MNYDLVCARHIVFGWQRSKELGRWARSLGSRAFLISGSRTLEANGTIDQFVKTLTGHDVKLLGRETLAREPEVDDVDRMTAIVRNCGVQQGDLLIAIGGGAAIDLAKAVSAMAVNREGDTVCDYLEGVGRGLTLDIDPLPMIAVPTTAGTGTEVTKNAVISSYDPTRNRGAPFKKSLRDTRMIPQIALVDPMLTASCPASVTASSGMDAITQLIESYVTRRAQPIPRALATQGLQLALKSIVVAVESSGCNSLSEPIPPSHRQAREAMSHAALLSGICLANAGLGMAHGVAPALGVHCRVPHGQACALMLPVSIRVNRSACETDYAELARYAMLLPNDMPDAEAVDRLLECIETIADRIGTPRRLADLDVTPDMIPELVRSSRGNSMSGNPRELTDEELTAILEEIA